jgi:hypothetical protein
MGVQFERKGVLREKEKKMDEAVNAQLAELEKK